MHVLLDDGEHEEPTRENMMAAIQSLVAGAADGDSLFFHFSGHGTQQRDTSGDEADGMDEALVPLDYQQVCLWTHGFLLSDRVPAWCVTISVYETILHCMLHI